MAWHLVERIKSIRLKARVTDGDMLHALGLHIRRIQQRTLQGLDYRGRPFAPYSIHGPYYYSPNGSSHLEKQQVALHHSRYYGGERKRGGTSVKYDSYAAYKAARGVTVPDLGGMEGSLLPNIMANVGGLHNADDAAGVNLDSYPAPCTYGEFGIYVEPAAKIAGYHNRGSGSRLPQRAFLGVSDDDAALIRADIIARIQARVDKAIARDNAGG